MSRKLIVKPAAGEDLLGAFSWYEERRLAANKAISLVQSGKEQPCPPCQELQSNAPSIGLWGVAFTIVDMGEQPAAAATMVAEVMTMQRPVEVKARPNYHLWLRYDDGTDGEVDLADMVGRGVFKAWDDVAFFEEVRIAPHGALVGGEDIDLCPDAMYLRLNGKRPEAIPS